MNDLKELRKNANLSQAGLAKLCGVTQATIAMWENGERKPDIIMLKRLAYILGCTTDDLLASIPVPEVKA